RVILFCTGTGIAHADVGITAHAMQSMAIKGFIVHDSRERSLYADGQRTRDAHGDASGCRAEIVRVSTQAMALSSTWPRVDDFEVAGPTLSIASVPPRRALIVKPWPIRLASASLAAPRITTATVSRCCRDWSRG